MKLTKVIDGRWLFEIAGHAIPLHDYQVDELAELTAFRHHVTGVVPTSSGVGLRLASNNEDAPVIHLCYTDQLPGTIATLQELVPEWMRDEPALRARQQELEAELAEERERVEAYAEGAESLRQSIRRVRNELEGAQEQAKKFRVLAQDLQEANARLDAELAGYKATRATGGPWRPADQTWVSADIEPPASASDDTAPPLFRGLTVDKKETAL